MLTKFPKYEGLEGILLGQEEGLWTKFSRLLLSRDLPNSNLDLSWLVSVAIPEWRKRKKGIGGLYFLRHPCKEGTSLSLQNINKHIVLMTFNFMSIKASSFYNILFILDTILKMRGNT